MALHFLGSLNSINEQFVPNNLVILDFFILVKLALFSFLLFLCPIWGHFWVVHTIHPSMPYLLSAIFSSTLLSLVSFFFFIMMLSQSLTGVASMTGDEV